MLPNLVFFLVDLAFQRVDIVFELFIVLFNSFDSERLFTQELLSPHKLFFKRILCSLLILNLLLFGGDLPLKLTYLKLEIAIDLHLLLKALHL